MLVRAPGGWYFIRCHRAIQRSLFAGRQSAKRSFRQVSELQRADRHSHQPEHLDFQRVQHAANLPVLALIEDDLEPTVLLSRSQ